MILFLKLHIMKWGPLLSVIILGIIIGWVFKRFIHSLLVTAAKKSKWEGDDVILKALEPQIIFWFFLASFSFSLKYFPVADPVGSYFSQILMILLILSVTHASSKLILGLFNLWSHKQNKGFPSTVMFTNIMTIAIYVTGVLIILDLLKISIAPMLTALGVGGLAVSLALKDTLSDIFAGLHILLSKKVQPGDFIHIDTGEMGYVTNISWRNTTVLERTNNIIHIPNTRLSSAIIKNYDSNDPSFSVKIPFGVAYSTDLDVAESIAMEVANKVHSKLEEANKDYQPSVRFKLFAESSINMMAYFRCNKYGDQHLIIHEFIKNLHVRFGEEKIEIPFPMRTVIQRDELIK